MSADDAYSGAPQPGNFVFAKAGPLLIATGVPLGSVAQLRPAQVVRVTQRVVGLDIVAVGSRYQPDVATLQLREPADRASAPGSALEGAYKPLKDTFSGTIKLQDVRATEIDKVDLHQSFRQGDVVRAILTLPWQGNCLFSVSRCGFWSTSSIHSLVSPQVRAQVLSLGDARSYYLTTARNELGVVFAKSAEAGVPMVPVSWTELSCPVSHVVEQRKVAQRAAGSS